jgi:hypothetical protein
VSGRGVFFEEEGARAVAARLVHDGFEARVVRERFAGEDDDADHPWAVLSDAPAVMLELLVEEHGGWLDDDPDGSVAPAASTPLDLPTRPRRSRRDC